MKTLSRGLLKALLRDYAKGLCQGSFLRDSLEGNIKGSPEGLLKSLLMDYPGKSYTNGRRPLADKFQNNTQMRGLACCL